MVTKVSLFKRLRRSLFAGLIGVSTVAVTQLPSSPLGAVVQDSNGYLWGNEVSHATFVPSDIVFTGTRFVMTGTIDPNVQGAAGGIRYSSDGITWSNATGVSSRWWTSIAKGTVNGNTVLVAGGYSTNQSYQVVGSYMAYSSDDGATWTEVDVTSNITYINDVTFGNGKYVVVGARNPGYNGGYALTSTNGSTWSTTSLCSLTNTCSGNIAGYHDARAVAYFGSAFVAAFSDGSIVRSTDGSTWTRIPMRIADGASSDIIGAGDSITGFGTNGTELIASTQWSQDIISSSDGQTWTSTSAQRVVAPTWLGGGYVAADTNFTGTFWFSSDGRSWQDYWIDGNTDQNNDANNPSSYSYSYRFKGFAVGGGKVVAIAQTFGAGKTITSVLPPSVSPATQTVSGTTGSAVTASTAFTPSNFAGAVSFAVTSGTLPAGLSISSSTGVISGTPTAASSATVTITATGATAGSATATVTFAIVQASISPSSQSLSGTAGESFTASAAFTPSNFTGAVSFAVTSGTLPAGLSISSSTGVISGTPTAASSATVTITATGATAGSATATVTFAIAPAATTTTAPAATSPTLVNSSNQSTLERTPGSATALVNGQPVSVNLETPADLPAAQVDPEDRTPAQVQALQAAADDLVAQFDQLAGGDSGLEVTDTPTGAAVTGLLSVPVPVESTVLVEAGPKSTLFAALNEDGTVTEVQPGAVIEVLGDGQVGVVASGLTPGESVEFVVMSTPTLLGTYTVGANGTIKAQASLPDGVGLGDHTLVVASPTVQASLGLKVSASPQTLPATGLSAGSNTVKVALWLMLGGVLVACIRRRRIV